LGLVFQLFIILVISASCVKKDVNDIQSIPTDYERITFSLDSIASDLLIIPLSDEIPVPYSYYVECMGNYIYYSYPPTGKIYRYNLAGKLVDVLDKKGRADKEYQYLYEYMLDYKSNIYISTGIDKIVVYNNKYNYLRDIKYPVKRNGLIKAKFFDKCIHLFYFNFSDSGFSWIMIDTLGDVLNSYPVLDKYEPYTRSNDIQLFSNNGYLYRFYNRNDTIYEIDKNGLKPYRIISRNFSDGFDLVVDNVDTNRVQLLQEPHRVINSIYGIGDYWLIDMWKYQSGKLFEVETVLYDYNNNRSYLINKVEFKDADNTVMGIPNDWIGSGSIYPRDIVEINGKKHLLYPLDAFNFIKYVNSIEFKDNGAKRPELKQKFQDVADNLTIEDNPVLLLLELK